MYYNCELCDRLQLDQLQAQLRHKTRLLEKMTASEGDHIVEINSLRENLSALNQEVTVKESEVGHKYPALM